jgi:hypothetical protein
MVQVRVQVEAMAAGTAVLEYVKTRRKTSPRREDGDQTIG